MQLKEEISSSVAQYKAFRSEMSPRMETGENASDIVAEREKVFERCNKLLDEYHSLITAVREKNVRMRKEGLPDEEQET